MSPRTILFCFFRALFMLHELEEIIWMPSFIKKLSITVSKQSNPVLLHAFCLQLLLSWSNFLSLLLSLFLSYWFNNYTIYTTIVIAYIYHVFGHLIQTIVLRKYVPGLLTGILTSLFTLCYLNPNIPNRYSYGYSLFTLLVIVLNLVVSFMILNKISHKK